LVGEDGSEGTSLYKEEFFDRAIKGEIKMPTITEIEIKDKSKGDGIAKFIVLVQTLWFGIQAAHRVSQGLIVTALEVTTLAHVVLNIFIYGFWWNKPLNVQCPVDVYPQVEAPSSRDKELGTGSQIPLRLEAPSSGDKELSGSEGEMPPQLEAPLSEEKERSGSEGAPGIASQIPTQLEVPLSEDKKRSGSEGARGTESQMPPRQPLPFRVRLATSFIGDDQSTASFGHVMFTLFFLPCLCSTPALFGAIHCLAWHSVFSSHRDQIIWRVSAVVVTVLPFLLFGLLAFYDKSQGTVAEKTLLLVNLFLALAYAAARICLLVVAFSALRALPYKALEVPSWSLYIPHIG